MATGWVKSLQCKSNAFEDVYHPKPSPSKNPLLPLSCGNSSQDLKDTVFLLPKHPPLPKKPHNLPPPPEHQPHPKNPRPRPRPRPKSEPKPKPKPASPSPPARPTSFPTLTELPEGHSSRRVVEIIFGSSWSHRGEPFPGEIEILFRVHNPPKTVARFEEYRSTVRSRADDARCAVDGNEMMRFHCAPSSSGGDGIYDASVVCCAVSSPGGKLKGIRTFDGSGGAHESLGGGAGRRAMLVCRVIAGRVRNESDPVSNGESVCAGKGELIVFDSRAVLPCFLIIYKV